MKKQRCAVAAAAVLTVCSVALLCRNQSVSEGTGGAESATSEVRASVPAVRASAAAQGASVASVSNRANQVAMVQKATVRGTKPYVLTCARGFGKASRLAVESLGARTVSVLSRNALLVEADVAALARIEADGRFAVKCEYLPSEKIAPELAAKIASGADAVEVSVVTLSPADHRRVQDRVVAHGGKILTGCFNEGTTFRARVPAPLVSELASFGDVRWMEAFVRPQVMNSVAVNPAAMNVRATWDVLGLSGEGQFVSTSDSGIDTGDPETMHKDLVNRVVEFKVVEECADHDPIGHGTHTAGSIAGDGTMSDGQIRGTAWGAKLYAWFCGKDDDRGIYTPKTIAELFRGDTAGEAWNAHIHSASWGSDVAGQYTAECADIDKYVWEHPDFLPVFSAGNSGPGYQSVGSPGSAKNVLTVGATQNLRSEGGGESLVNGDPTQTAEYSSRGSCRDGRIKPDVAAPGTGILSTRAAGIDYSYGNYNDYYAYDTGTSMACPLTAGAMALVRQWLLRDMGFTEDNPPSAALMKAVITGGAKDVTKPNNDQGWGRVDLMGTLAPSDRALKLIDRIEFAEGREFTWLVVTTNDAPFDVQLAWIDYPGDPAEAVINQASPKIINDLDLSVRAIDDVETLLGNGGSRADRLNTLESVRIASSGARRYLVTVSCPSVMYDYSDGGAAALYMRGAFDPDEIVPYWTARIVKSPETTNTYTRLEKALSEAESGDVVEILDMTILSESVTLTNAVALTVTATNAIPSATPIFRNKGADILVRKGSLFFTNLVFRTELTTPVRAADAGVVKVAGRVVLDDIVSGTPGILVSSPLCLELAGRLENGITVECTGASKEGDRFGYYTCSPAVAKESAPRLVSNYGVDRAGAADASMWLLWSDGGKVAPEAAVGYVDGDEPVYYRTLDRLFDDNPNGTNVVVMRSGARLEKARTLHGPQSISAPEGAGEIVVRPAGSAGFTLADGCELTLSGIAFEGYQGNCLFCVNGADASLTAADVAFRDIEGTNVFSGAVAILKGSAKLTDSTFTNCRATGDHWERSLQKTLWKAGGKTYGGGIYLAGDGCSLELSGGSITGCRARQSGGGIYAGAYSTVRISGSLVVKDNTSGDAPEMDDDIYLVNAISLKPTRAKRATLELADVLTGTDAVGIRYSGSGLGYGNDIGNVFATGDAGITSISAPAFFNDTDLEKIVPDVGDDKTTLVWREWMPGDGQVDDPALAVAKVVASGSDSTEYYATVEQAFAAAKDGSRIVLLKNVTFTEPVWLRAKNVTFEPESGKLLTLSRSGDVSITVLPGASLSVANMTVRGGWGNAGIFHVQGGALTLLDGAVLTDVNVSADSELRAAGAVTVWNHGTFTMERGSRISYCYNDFRNHDSKAAYGGGVSADESVVHLRGGIIEGCSAGRGGGVFIGNGSVLYISGDVTVDWNFGAYSETDNICVSDDSQMYLTGNGALTGTFGFNEGRSADKCVFGKVDPDFKGTLADALASAHRFTHDYTGDVGMAVTDGDETLLVWSSALAPDGTFTDGNGRTYDLIDGEKFPVGPFEGNTFVYDGTPKTVIEDGIGYFVVANATATDAGSYTAKLEARPGFELVKDTVEWAILPIKFELAGITFEDREYTYDGTAKKVEIAGELPDWLKVSYENNIRWNPGTNDVTATISGSNPNYTPNPFVTNLYAKLIVLDPAGKFIDDVGPHPVPPEPKPEEWEIVTYHPEPVAFKSIDRVGDTEWSLVVTNRVQYCNYRLLWTEDLSKGFTETGKWEHAVGPAATPVWTTNVTTTGGAWFWRAEGTEGTNMVRKTVK